MSSVKKGILKQPCQWRKHLRPEWRRVQWKKERQAEKSEIRAQFKDASQ